jgi:hypothetical protein
VAPTGLVLPPGRGTGRPAAAGGPLLLARSPAVTQITDEV